MIRTAPIRSALSCPGKAGRSAADSSVSPFTVDLTNIFNIKIFNNYNFAVARVRLRGSSGTAGEAKNPRSSSACSPPRAPDTDFQPATYPSNPDAVGQPGTPRVGADHVTLPFFATGNLSSNTDYTTGGVNDLDIEIPTGGDSVWPITAASSTSMTAATPSTASRFRPG